MLCDLRLDLLDIALRRRAEVVEHDVRAVTRGTCTYVSTGSSYMALNSSDLDIPRAMARPIPVEQPVTTTTLPGRRLKAMAVWVCDVLAEKSGQRGDTREGSSSGDQAALCMNREDQTPLIIGPLR